MMVSNRVRLHGLQVLEQDLENYYVPFNARVDKPYSKREQVIVYKIIRFIDTQLQKKVKVGTAGKSGERLGMESLGEQEMENERVFQPGYFKFTLEAKNPFSASSRQNYLSRWGDLLRSFFEVCNSQATGVPYSHQEEAILKRIKRIWIHELKDTPKYAKLKKKPRSPKPLSAEEKLELKRQRTDEIRLKVVRFPCYNPVSKKYQELKKMNGGGG